MTRAISLALAVFLTAILAPAELTESKAQSTAPSTKGKDKMTVLLLGVDCNQRKERFTGARSDATMLITVDMSPDKKKVVFTSIPRDSRVYIKGHGLNKINAAHAIGGARLACSTVQSDFGVPVDHYVVVDLAALKKICELIGPVEVNVEKSMHYVDKTAHLCVDLKPGCQQLSPAQVEQFLRFRHDRQSDIGRIGRQQHFLKQAMAKVCQPAFLLKLPSLIATAHSYVRTDLSLQDMIRIAFSCNGVKPSQVKSASLPGKAQLIHHISYWILDPGAAALMRQIYQDT